MIALKHGTPMTLSEYRVSPENEGVWELIDGILEKQPPATAEHQMLIGSLVSAIITQASETTPPLGVAYHNGGVAFSESFAPTPDILYVRFEQFHLIQGSFVEGIPDLLVEVLSADRSRDLDLKRARYATAGVPEYWIVDPVNDIVIVLELSGDEYVERAVLSRNDTLTTPVIPGFSMPLEQLFGTPGLDIIRRNR